jgi:hypothetical protein
MLKQWSGWQARRRRADAGRARARADVRLFWHPQGDYLAVQVDRFTKTRKSTYTAFELFSVKERDIPMEARPPAPTPPPRARAAPLCPGRAPPRACSCMLRRQVRNARLPPCCREISIAYCEGCCRTLWKGFWTV